MKIPFHMSDDLARYMLDTAPAGHVVYVKDDEGRIFGTVELQEEVLSDGSVAYNFVLYE